MLLKTKGIVLRFVKYKETSVIATVYTVEKGLISVIANSVRSKNSKSKIALFQPLTLVDLVIYNNSSKNISRVSEISSFYPLHNLRQDPIKASISFFITEMLNKCLKEEESNPPFFNFIQNSIIHLNEQEREIQNFHLIFLIKLSLFMGFKPHSTADFINQIPNSSLYREKSISKLMDSMLIADYESPIKLTSVLRSNILDDLVSYYKSHLDIGKVNSIEVLHQLLHN
ncbi:MAG: DNA repair protein RecO [Cyclobacteriaceae bacterium]|nr:DNA repair protein RecO [Cyclobacteriaceae bacterium]